MRNILLYLIAGTRGGYNRGRIINSLIQKPMNIHKLSKELRLDYKTVQHHVDLLVENRVLSVIKKGSYGAVYVPSEEFDSKQFKEIWERFG